MLCMLLNEATIFSRLYPAISSCKLNFGGRCLSLPEENDVGRTSGWKIKLDKFRSVVR